MIHAHDPETNKTDVYVVGLPHHPNVTGREDHFALATTDARFVMHGLALAKPAQSYQLVNVVMGDPQPDTINGEPYADVVNRLIDERAERMKPKKPAPKPRKPRKK